MKTKLLVLALFFSFAGFSQTIALYNTNPGTNFTIVTPAAALDQSPTGANVFWTFDNLTPAGTNIDTYAAPDATQLTTYPGTTEVQTITTQGMTPTSSVFFLREDGTGNYITGASQGDIVLNYNTTNAFIGLFPLSFGANNSGTAAGTFSYQGTNGTFTGTFTATVDAYGTLTMTDAVANDYVANVTRLRIDQSLSFSIPPIFNDIGTLTQTTYYYYDNNASNIAFRYNNATLVSGFLGINETTETHERNTSLTLSRNAVTAAQFELYPNPANDFITIQSKDNLAIKSVSIVDVQGRNVFTTNSVASRISVANLQQGMYFVTLETTSGAVTTKKFMKQ
ncbi:putative secreted protein (Por secretion system target) [Kordia periserrulae]|uniref:Putative secreted protein (Por secretion system target) n=1 Tax=Kordia periserrulae TaxID=701523 RepID=A0A2T6BYN5_9FLAO|nr:T9SS type A sorting domain-containing protein [Kordia periserrulae]PTX61172.1 putative secreted protein (Por secretion system target) [Kordia periserrulae]